MSQASRKLTQTIRKGRTFTVCRAVLDDGRCVVTKAPTQPSETAIARLENEFAITRALDHPGIVRALDLDRSGGPGVLILPDDGLSSLDMRHVGPLPVEDVRHIARGVGAALAHLHDNGVIHRDVKPSNIVASADHHDVRLIDFCLATREADLAGEAPGAFAALGTAAYMAPEQSGRMNRAVDARADLYSLGVTLYELLTGVRPFDDDDPARITYRHMTDIPLAPTDLADVPDDLSAAVMVLLEKNPEDRYQSAAEFLAAIEGGGHRRAPLAIPDRLYGRDDLLDTLSQEIAIGATGPSRFYRVTGQSGIGKTALIQRLVEPAIARGATFLPGKFDQQDRTRPYAPFLQAAGHLLRRLLAGSPDEVDEWRGRIVEAVSPNGQVLLDVLPDYHALIGAQPPVAELGLNEARIRMSLVFRRFVRALARLDTPLILFFDDLQWSDAASRSLISLLLTDPEIRNLTIVCAYRDNEIGPAHPVRDMFAELDEQIDLKPEIRLDALDRPTITAMLADTLNRMPDEVSGLAALIQSKTAGNPFFVRQFLFALLRKGLLTRREDKRGWHFDLSRIEAEGITDNVADLVVERILALPRDTQRIVQIAACCDAEFEAEILALAADKAPYEVARLLEPAVSADVVLPVGEIAPGERPDRYRFQHDRVQQAAQDTLAPDHRAEMHARIGELLLAKTPEDQLPMRLTRIADHLIVGKRYLDARLRAVLRDLALAAARRTRLANAWDAAERYLAVAEDLIGPNGWQTEPELLFDVTIQKAETAYLRNDYVEASDITKALLARDLPVLNRVKVLELQVLLQTSRLNYRRALEIGKEALALLGERLPMSPKAPRLLSALMGTRFLLRGHDEKSLLRLAKMTDPEKLATIRILGLLAAPAYFTELYLLPLIGLRIVNLTVRHGNAPHSPYGYVIYGMLHCAVLRDPVKGRAYGDLARASVARLGASETDARVCMVHGGFIQHWTAPLSESLPVFEEGWEKAVAAGDLEYHGYARYGYASYALMAGTPLNRVADILDRHLAAVIEHPHEKTHRIMVMARASVARMRGQVPDPDRPFDAEASYALWTEQRDATSLAYFHKYAMLEALMAGDHAGVLDHANGMTRNLNGILSMAYEGFYQFYEGLSALELARSAGPVERNRLRRKGRALTRRLHGWARHAPRTFAHRARLLEAEMAALDGASDTAIGAFEDAIAAARDAGALHDLGLFHERAANFYLSRGAKGAAGSFLAEAQSAYMAWGALGWAEALAQKFPDAAPLRPMIARTPGGDVAESSTASSQIVDSATLIAAAAALSSKTSLRDVVAEVMRAIVVNAGADRGVLLLTDRDDLRAVAEVDGTDVRLLDPDDGAACDGFARSIVNYVRRSESQLVLDDAVMDPSFSIDPHVQETRPASVLCVPLLAKGDVTGVVYLENTRVRGMFTPERCVTVSVLGAQAAVSVENARLFDELRTALDRQVELTDAHARFVPHSFLQVLNRPSIDQIRLGDHVQAEASILFSDIRGFTALVESMEPQEAIEFINAYLSRMEPAVQEGGGFVDSYIGDAVMAVFDRGPEAAIQAGIAMIRALRAWTRANRGEQPIRIGLGIASGEIMFGTIGAANRMKCGVIGSTVNLASRIEGLTKRYGLGMLISQGTFRTLPDPNRFMIRDVDLVTVVGRQAPVRLLEVFDADPRHLREQKARTKKDIYWGLRLYRNGAVEKALEIFDQCCAIAPDDPLAPILRDRARRTAERGNDPDWDGAERMAEK